MIIIFLFLTYEFGEKFRCIEKYYSVFDVKKGEKNYVKKNDFFNSLKKTFKI